MRVRIKTWNQLLATPGVKLIAGEIHGKYDVFTSKMRYLCGKEIELCSVNPEGDPELGQFENWNIWDFMVVGKGDNFDELYNKLNGN